LPLVFVIQNLTIEERFERTRQVSAITHGHIRAVMACFYYLEFAKQLIEGKTKFDIYNDLQTTLPSFFITAGIDSTEIAHFDRLLQNNIADLSLPEMYLVLIDNRKLQRYCSEGRQFRPRYRHNSCGYRRARRTVIWFR
jgi:ADP-ribosylglycohydrolase